MKPVGSHQANAFTGLKRESGKKPSFPAPASEAELTRDQAVLQQDGEQASPKKWTILAYLGADNNLQTAQTANLQRMIDAGANSQVNILAQIDYKDKPRALRYTIPEKGRPFKATELGKINSADPAVLADFLGWGMKNYPAQNYLVVIGSHGGGFKGVIRDDTDGDLMSISNLQKALKKAETESGTSKAQVSLLFDACLMGQTEVAYELKDAAEIMIASEQTITAGSFPYRAIIPELSFREPEKTVDSIFELAGKYDRYGMKIPNLAAVKLDKMPEVKKAVEKMAKALLATKTDSGVIKQIIRDTRSFHQGADRKPYVNFIDLYDFAENLNQNPQVQDLKLKTATSSVMKSVKEAVFKQSGPEDTHGLSIYASSEKADYREFKYLKIAFARNSLWPKAMEKFGGR